MGRNSIGVSGFALTVSKAIRAQLGMRRMSGRELAQAIGRGPTYVRERINDEKEWALGDLERMCNLWSLTPRQLIESVPDLPSSVSSAADDEQAERDRRAEETERLLRENPMALAADMDPDKNKYIQYGDGNDPA